MLEDDSANAKIKPNQQLEVKKSIETFAKLIVDILKPVLTELDKIIFPNSVENTREVLEKVRHMLLDLGYPPHPGIALIEIHRIIKYDSENERHKTEKLIRRLILKVFNDEVIKELLNDWSKYKWIRNRYPIIKEGLLCHLEGKYYASISTLLPQLEGMIAQKFDHQAHLSPRQLKEYIEMLLDEKGMFTFDEGIKLFYLNILLDRFHHGCIINSPLSRHAILHGGDINFGYKANSLRCIILMDYLLDKFK